MMGLEIKLYVFLIVLPVYTGTAIDVVDLHFASTNCDEEVRRVTETKVYNLIWNGQNTPKLCDFTFSGGLSQSYKICFESRVFSLSSSMTGVQLKIRNYTKSAWSFDRHDSSISKTCIQYGYRVEIWIHLTTGYTPPSSKTYIELRVDAEVISDSSSEFNASSIAMTVIGVVIFIVFSVCGFIWVKSEGRLCDRLGEMCRSCLDTTCACLMCKCLRDCECPSCRCLQDCDRPSCNCNFDNFCKPCGECCTAWASCCTTLILSSCRGNTVDQSNDNNTELDEISQAENTALPPGSPLRSPEPPPSYRSIQAQHDPTLPPPSYEAVTGKTVPSAPPSKGDY